VKAGTATAGNEKGVQWQGETRRTQLTLTENSCFQFVKKMQKITARPSDSWSSHCIATSASSQPAQDREAQTSATAFKRPPTFILLTCLVIYACM